MERFERDTHDTDRHMQKASGSEKHIIGVPGKNIVGNILNKYKSQMKFVDIDDEKNWWKERPVQRKPLNIYREDQSDDSDLEITGVKKGSKPVTLVPGAV